ncbi:MAG: ATP-binding protein [Steroidobacteraceae bacterium]|nr:ATP-binding protein [Deltaproteobacteria bacterium]
MIVARDYGPLLHQDDPGSSPSFSCTTQAALQCHRDNREDAVFRGEFEFRTSAVLSGYSRERLTHPCPCGYLSDPTHPCTCTPVSIHHYRSRISGPLLDKIDIHIEVPAVKYRDLDEKRYI